MDAVIKQQGTLLSMKIKAPQVKGRTGGGQRGIVTTFSRGSRLRLMDLFARLETRGIRTTFLTLTFHGEPTPERAKTALKRFLMHVRYHYPTTSGVWRQEYQERGAIHYHLLLFNLPYWDWQDLLDTWTRCTEEDTSGIWVKLISGRRKTVMSYVSKYVAKVADPALLGHVTYRQKFSIGRQWGYLNKEALPYAEIHEIGIDGADIIDYLYHWGHRWTRGKCFQGSLGARAYIDDALEVVIFAGQHADRLYVIQWGDRSIDRTFYKRAFSPARTENLLHADEQGSQAAFC